MKIPQKYNDKFFGKRDSRDTIEGFIINTICYIFIGSIGLFVPDSEGEAILPWICYPIALVRIWWLIKFAYEIWKEKNTNVK